MKKLALFDFDGTLTMKDSLNEFLKYAVGIKTYFYKLVCFLPIFIGYKLGIISNDKAKQKLLILFFKDWDEKKFKKIAFDFSKERLELILNYEVYNKFLNMKKNGYRVIVISASLECWLKFWCDLHDVELLSTKLKFENSKVTGEFLTPNCYGKEKVNRLKNYLNIDEYDEIISFGDSKADKYIFDISDKWFLVK